MVGRIVAALAFFVILVVLCVALLQSNNDEIISGLPNAPQQIVDTWIDEQPGGAVVAALVYPDKTEYFFGGKSSPTNPALPNDQTLFEVGSITKVFTGLLLAEQVLSGNVFLNDTLVKLLTDWPGRFSSALGLVTLLELATHTAGLPKMPAIIDEDSYEIVTKKKLYSWLDEAVPSNRGSYLYSNVGVGILGHVLGVHSGKTYEDLLKERVLLPLGLKDATISLNDKQKRRLAPGHGDNGEVVKNYEFEILAPAGGLHFSIAGLTQFLHFATGLKDYGGERMADVLEFTTRSWGNSTRVNTTIGLCWMRLLMPQDKLQIWHGGATIGYRAYVGWIQERQIGVALLTSTSAFPNATESLARDLLKQVP